MAKLILAAIILTADTLINGIMRRRGEDISNVATGGEIESLLYMQRARKTAGRPDPDPEPKPPELDPEPPELDPEPPELEQTTEAELEEFEALEKWVDSIGLPRNVFEALYESGVRSLDLLRVEARREGYRLSSIKGIGPKSEERIREALAE